MALVLLLALTIWGSYRDLQFLRATLLEVEIDRLRSHAERSVGRIEQELRMRAATDLEKLDRDTWLHQHWRRVIPNEERRLYAAVVDRYSKVLLHSDDSRQGTRLPHNWYDHVLFEVGDDVVETHSPVLALGELAYDVRVPIAIDGREVGEYHTGFDVNWFESQAKERQSAFIKRRSLLVGGVLLIVLLATTSLYYIATHSITLRRAADSASLERATEVGKLAAGLAHEIRNPLHAIQLNLHTFRRAHEQGSELSAEEMGKMMEQSTREIDRIEQLMQQLVNFAAPDEPRDEVVDLTSEIRDVVDFIQQEMLDNNVKIKTVLPSDPIRAQMDRGRLRQIMLNLLQNSQQAMENGGQIRVELARRRSRVEITVADNGAGIREDDRKRIFEPFYSTKSDGTGLGLALVKRFIEEVNGEIECESNEEGGVTFRVRLREVSSP